jgi:protein TonB
MNRALSAAFIISIFVHVLLILPIYPGSSVEKGSPIKISMGSLRIIQGKAENKRPITQKVASYAKPSEQASKPNALTSCGAGEDNRERYLSEIRRRIMESRRYPDIARVKGFEGISQVEFIISQEGEIEKVSLIRSSNYQCLDEEVIEAVKRASPFPPIPEAFSSSKIKVAISIIFKLEGKS